MVQLLEVYDFKNPPHGKFQFQYGAIISEVHEIDWDRDVGFNSSMVQLLDFYAPSNIILNTVSIPVWCNY